MQVDFPGIVVDQDDDAVILRSVRPLRTLSSAVVGGGLADTQVILNRYVHKDYASSDPAADLITFARARGIDEPFIGLLTAVPMRKARSRTIREGALTVCAIITAGVGNASAVGITPPRSLAAGTINLVLLVEGDLGAGALVNAVMTATEAKTATLLERGVRTPEGCLATGTSTDASVIACTGQGVPQAYAGPVTPVGYLIGRSVRECLAAALDAE